MKHSKKIIPWIIEFLVLLLKGSSEVIKEKGGGESGSSGKG